MLNLADEIKFNDQGLVPAITQDNRTDEVLMMAWMNREALEKTLETGKVHYWSRSRQSLWLKGETSGHFQELKSIRVDCDGDTLLLKVEQKGAACHTGHRSCFYRAMEASIPVDAIASIPADTATVSSVTPDTAILLDADESDTPGALGTDKACSSNSTVLEDVFNVILDRKLHPKEGSYTNYLFDKGLEKILKKVGEETAEVIIAAMSKSNKEITYEVGDLFYHVFVLLVERGMSLEDIYNELKGRR